MAIIYSLYDVLVSINVPSDKARAVVDAMERDMGITLAIKRYLENARHLQFDAYRSDMAREFAAFERRMMLKLGSMLLAGLCLTIAVRRI